MKRTQLKIVEKKPRVVVTQDKPNVKQDTRVVTKVPVPAFRPIVEEEEEEELVEEIEAAMAIMEENNDSIVVPTEPRVEEEQSQEVPFDYDVLGEAENAPGSQNEEESLEVEVEERDVEQEEEDQPQEQEGGVQEEVKDQEGQEYEQEEENIENKTDGAEQQNQQEKEGEEDSVEITGSTENQEEDNGENNNNNNDDDNDVESIPPSGTTVAKTVEQKMESCVWPIPKSLKNIIVSLNNKNENMPYSFHYNPSMMFAKLKLENITNRVKTSTALEPNDIVVFTGHTLESKDGSDSKIKEGKNWSDYITLVRKADGSETIFCCMSFDKKGVVKVSPIGKNNIRSYIPELNNKDVCKKAVMTGMLSIHLDYTLVYKSGGTEHMTLSLPRYPAPLIYELKLDPSKGVAWNKAYLSKEPRKRKRSANGDKDKDQEEDNNNNQEDEEGDDREEEHKRSSSPAVKKAAKNRTSKKAAKTTKGSKPTTKKKIPSSNQHQKTPSSSQDSDMEIHHDALLDGEHLNKDGNLDFVDNLEDEQDMERENEDPESDAEELPSKRKRTKVENGKLSQTMKDVEDNYDSEEDSDYALGDDKSHDNDDNVEEDDDEQEKIESKLEGDAEDSDAKKEEDSQGKEKKPLVQRDGIEANYLFPRLSKRDSDNAFAVHQAKKQIERNVLLGYVGNKTKEECMKKINDNRKVIEADHANRDAPLSKDVHETEMADDTIIATPSKLATMPKKSSQPNEISKDVTLSHDKSTTISNPTTNGKPISSVSTKKNETITTPPVAVNASKEKAVATKPTPPRVSDTAVVETVKPKSKLAVVPNGKFAHVETDHPKQNKPAAQQQQKTPVKVTAPSVSSKAIDTANTTSTAAVKPQKQVTVAKQTPTQSQQIPAQPKKPAKEQAQTNTVKDPHPSKKPANNTTADASSSTAATKSIAVVSKIPDKKDQQPQTASTVNQKRKASQISEPETNAGNKELKEIIKSMVKILARTRDDMDTIISSLVDYNS